jgi:hypothetical protein
MKKKGFVCQSCNNLVPPNTDRCPHCGKYFKGVRCPECHFVGVSTDFVHGCPSCGYLADEKKNDIKLGQGVKNEKSLPAWFYLISAGVLTVLVGVFLFMLFKI